jgi:hypothetical protein
MGIGPLLRTTKSSQLYLASYPHKEYVEMYLHFPIRFHGVVLGLTHVKLSITVYFCRIQYVAAKLSVQKSEISLLKYSLLKYSLLKYSLLKYSLLKDSLLKYSLLKYSLLKYSLLKYSLLKYSLHA